MLLLRGDGQPVSQTWKEFQPSVSLYEDSGGFIHGPGFYLEEMVFKELIGENNPSSYCYYSGFA